MKLTAITLLASLFAAGTAQAQFGGLLDKAQKAREVVSTLKMSDEDEQSIGAGVSERVRRRYGVVQDPAVHKYLTLVGTVLTQASTRPGLLWTFVVLDTDGVNAFAAPGGYVHITRGALALLRDESELAGVLAHEIIHVTEKHTISAIQKNKMVQMGANETLKGNASLLNAYVDRAFELVFAGFGRGEELESDQKGVVLANKAGYAPAGLSAFLERLRDRNKAATEKQGLFASHPEMQERIDKLTKQIAADRLAATVTLPDRYKKAITYQPRPQAEIAAVEAGSAGLAGGGKGGSGSGGKANDKDAKQDDQPKKTGAFGLGALARPGGGSEKKSAEVTSSGGSRGVDSERNARGGDNPALVAVTVSASEIGAFKKEGGLR